MKTTSQTETLFVVLPENLNELYGLMQYPDLKRDYFAQSHLLLAYLLYRRDDKTHAEAMHEVKHSAIKYMCPDR